MLNNKILMDVVRANTMLNAKKLAYLKSTIEYIVSNSIAGDIVECGVWMGGSVVLLANELLQYNCIRTFRLFDSFNDPHEPLPIDGNYMVSQLGGHDHATGKLIPVKGYYNKVTKGKGPGNAKHVYKLLTKVVEYPKEHVKIYKGWFQKTLLPYSKRIDKISLLIIDCDLYDPTKLCLEYLYDKVVPNGIIFIDDYPTLNGCVSAVNEYFENRKLHFEFIQVPNTGSIYITKK